MEILLGVLSTALGLGVAVAALLVIVLALGALVEVCTGGVISFGITTRPQRRSRR